MNRLYYTIIVTVTNMVAAPSYTGERKYYDEHQEVTVFIAKSVKKANEKLNKLYKKYERVLKLQGSPLYSSFTDYDHFRFSTGELYNPDAESYIKDVNVKIFEAKMVK